MVTDDDNRLIAPCVAACPAQVDVPRYMGYVALGRFAEAHATVREAIPLPVACGLICYRPCEPWCRRGIMEEPVAINAVKRAAWEHDRSGPWRSEWSRQIALPTGRRIAVVGSGPAGLTAAYYLARRRGHHVTIFEAMPELGGQLRYGLPEYKVPREALRNEIALLTETRVNVKTGVRVQSIDRVASEFDAVLLAIGQTKPTPLDVRGKGVKGVRWASRFLQDVNLGKRPAIGSRVVVLGGNNVAFDSARCAVRLGAEDVRVVMPVPRAFAAAHDFEVVAAEEEGVLAEEMTQAVRLAKSGDGVSVTLERLQVVHTDDVGRETYGPVSGSRVTLEADSVLVSMGQEADVPFEWDVASEEWGVLKVDGEEQATSRRGVFAGGDVVTGPGSIVDAMDQGKRAARSIDRYLGGDGDIAERFTAAPGDEMTMPLDLAAQGKPAVRMKLSKGNARTIGFELVEQGYSASEAKAEARRCIRCDLWRSEIPDVWSKQQG